MKKQRIVWIALGMVLLVAGITAASTQTQTWHRVHNPLWFHHGPMGFIAHDLDLSDNQKSQIKSIWEGERPNVSELVHQLASEQKELDALTFRDETPDDARIQDITARQGVTIAKLLAEKEKISGKIYSQVLNPSQRIKAHNLLDRFDSHLDRIANRIGK